jgi:general secretion pathway protein F
MRFEVKAVGTAGNIVRLGVDALDADDALAQAAAGGYRVLALRRSWRALVGRASRRTPLPMVLFCQELLALLDAGLALVEALDTLAEKEERPEARRILAQVVGRLREGQSLSSSLERSGGSFGALFIATIRASETSGGLPQALARYVEYQSQMDRVRRQIASAMVYPLVLACVGLLVTLFLLLYVVPRFSQVYADAGAGLPLSSRLLINCGQFMGAHPWLVAGSAAAVLACTAWGLGQEATRRWLVRRAWQLPALGRRLHLFQLSRFYRSLGMLLRGGMPFGTAMPLAAGLLQPELRARLQEAGARIREGQSISQAMHANGLTTPVALRMLLVGERSGAMGEMMERIAAFYEEDTARWVERAAGLFEPLLMTAVGLLIGCIVVLMYMPIFDLAGSIQ